MGTPEPTFLLPGRIVNEIFGKMPSPEKRWLFNIYENNGKHTLVTGDKAEYEIEEFLNRWDQIPVLAQIAKEKRFSFADLQKFILNEMRMGLLKNYQPIMIRTLLEHGGRASKDEIAEKIKELNQDNPEQDFRNIPVYDVLEKHGIVRKENDEFQLNLNEITPDQRDL